MQEFTIYIGSDHRGFQDKAEIVEELEMCHDFLKVVDLGPTEYNPEDDFNDAAIAVGKAVRDNEHSVGVLLCGSAHGVTMQANRIKGVRAIHASTPESAKIGREHDHANVVCLSADELDPMDEEPIIKAFCHARPDMSEKYLRRVKRLDEEV